MGRGGAGERVGSLRARRRARAREQPAARPARALAAVGSVERGAPRLSPRLRHAAHARAPRHAGCSHCAASIRRVVLRGRFAYAVVSHRAFNDQQAELQTLDTEHLAHAPRGAGPRRPERRPAHRRLRPARPPARVAPCCACATTSPPRSCSRDPTGPPCSTRGSPPRSARRRCTGGRVIWRHGAALRSSPALPGQPLPAGARAAGTLVEAGRRRAPRDGRRRDRRAAGTASRPPARPAASTASSSACSARSRSSSGRRTSASSTCAPRRRSPAPPPRRASPQQRDRQRVGHARPAPPRRVRRRAEIVALAAGMPERRLACGDLRDLRYVDGVVRWRDQRDGRARRGGGCLIARTGDHQRRPAALASTIGGRKRWQMVRRPASMQGPSPTTRSVRAHGRRRPGHRRALRARRAPRMAPTRCCACAAAASRQPRVADRARAGGRVRRCPRRRGRDRRSASSTAWARRPTRSTSSRTRPSPAPISASTTSTSGAGASRCALASSRDLRRWRKFADLDAGGGGMGTLRALPGGGFLLAYEAQRPTQPNGKVATNVRLRWYRDAAALLGGRATEERTLPRRLSPSNEGTPNFRAVTWRGSLSRSRGPAGLSLARPRAEAAGRPPGPGDARRRQVVGVQGGRASTARCRSMGFHGNHGARRQFRFPAGGKLWRIYEAQEQRERHRVVARVPLRRRRAPAQAPADPHAAAGRGRSRTRR